MLYALIVPKRRGNDNHRYTEKNSGGGSTKAMARSNINKIFNLTQEVTLKKKSKSKDSRKKKAQEIGF